jgi:heme/copper-type cytochrome/quinol oxidase subunit 2
MKSAPSISDSGLYEETSEGRKIRVYTNLDTRLMLDDLVAKPALTVKIVGRQWYWSYRLKESVHLTLSKSAENLLELDTHSLLSF